MNSLVSVGKISKLFGTGGEVAINLYDTFPDNINIEEPLFVRIDSLTVPLFLEKFERRGRSGALVSFADIDTEKRITELLGFELLLPEEESDDSDDDLVYLEDFVGFTVSFDDRKETGTIVEFIESDHNPLFKITINGAEAFVPAVEEFIEFFDLKKRRVKFTLPEGLLDLYL